MPTLAASFDRLVPHLAPVLLELAARTRLVGLIRVLPFFSVGFLEFRLAVTEPQVDFSVALRELPPDLPRPWLETPEWQAVEALCRRRQRSVLTADGLEFDLDSDPDPIPRPRLFVAPFREDTAGLTSDEVLDMLEVIQPVIPVLPVGFRSHLETCLEALPRGGRLLVIGTFRTPVPVVRLVMELPPSEATPSGVVRYLHAIGCDDAARHLAPVLARLGPPTSFVNLDVSDRIEPRVDVEFSLSGRNATRDRHQALFSALVELGLASQTKSDALMAWPGATRLHPARTVSDLADRLMGRNLSPLLVRKLTHMKVCCYPAGRLQAKAYAQFSHFSATGSLIRAGRTR